MYNVGPTNVFAVDPALYTSYTDVLCVLTAAFHARVRGSVPGLGGFKETKLFLPHPRVKVSIVGSLRDREVACSASDRQGSNFESCVWRTVSSQSSHHPQEVLLAQFSLYVHKGGLKPDSFHFICVCWDSLLALHGSIRAIQQLVLVGVHLTFHTQRTTLAVLLLGRYYRRWSTLRQYRLNESFLGGMPICCRTNTKPIL